MDKTLFYAVNHGMQNGLLDWLMPALTRYENWIPAGLLLAAWLIRKNPSKGVAVIFAATAAVVLADYLSHHFVKEFFGRVRPCRALPDVHLVVGCGKSASFPSSHAWNAFTVASVLGLYEKKLRVAAFSSAALVAFARVYEGVHYPADVLAGALLGVCFGWAVLRLLKIK